MQEKYTGNAVIERGYAIYDEWNKNKYKSRKIVNSVQMAVASTNAKNTPGARIEALAQLFALDLRIEERYNTLAKCIFLYFSWRRETGAFKRLKGLLKMPEGNDFRALIEIELERLRQNINVNKTEGSDKNTRGGKVTEYSGEEAVTAQGEQQIEATVDEATQGGRDMDSGEETIEETTVAENAEEKAYEKTSDRADVAEGQIAVAENPQEKSSGSTDGDKIEINQENLFKNKDENNGSGEKKEPSINKNQENTGYNGAIDTNTYYEVIGNMVDAGKASFIDEVIMDNMVKGESDVIGHNPLEGVKQGGEARSQSIDTQNAEGLKDGKDAHLYDKMVLDGKVDSVVTEPNAPKTEQKPQNLPREKEQVVVNDKPNDDVRVQIKIEENVSEENQFRRDINDKFTDKMVLLHKSLMEDALREEFKIDEREFGNDRPVIFEENNIEDAVDEITSVRKH